MQIQRRAAMAGSVFLIALGTGYIMQNGDAVASRFSADNSRDTQASIQQDTPVHQPIVALQNASAPLPRDPSVVALAQPAPRVFADRTPQPDTGMTDVIAGTDGALSPFGLPCVVELIAVPGPAATVLLSIDAPCHAGQPITVSQDVLRFTDVLSSDGTFQARVPALSTAPEFNVSFEGGTEIQAQALVPEASGYERVALQWQGDTGLQLHAFEFGADYGDAGHVHAAAAYAPERALQMGAGYLTQLGRPSVPGGWVGEVYSFPASDARDRGVVRISIEAEVTATNCGRDISAETLQPVLGSGLDVVDVTFAVPACDAVGDFLVLNNVLRDMKIAAN